MRPVPFVPFTDADFDAFQRLKWQSNVFNRERLEVKEKFLALGRRLNPSLTARDGSLLEYEVSAEHPALWNQKCVRDQYLFFSRNKEARKDLDGIINKGRTMASLIEDPSPLRHHIFLSVMIDNSQLDVALKLHADAAVDRDNLCRKGQEFFNREKLLGLLQDLPAEFRVGLVGQEEHAPADLSDEILQSLLNSLPTADSWFTIHHSIPRQDSLALDSEFEEFARQRLILLMPLLHFIAWERDNDFVSIRETLKEKKIQRESKGLQQNDHVRVVQGVFSGKRGKVEDVDTKGRLKVRIGTMVVKLKSQDVERA